MLSKAQKADLRLYGESAYTISQDLSKSAFPTYVDGIKTKADFFEFAQKSFRSTMHEILIYKIGGEFAGWIDYYWLDADRYIGISVFNIRAQPQVALDEFLAYIRSKFSGYRLDFGLPVENIAVRNYFKALGHSPMEISEVFTLDLADYPSGATSAQVYAITPDNFEDFRKLHAGVEMYWDSNKLWQAISQPQASGWRILGYYADGVLQAAIYFVYSSTMTEVFGLDYAPGTNVSVLLPILFSAAKNQAKLEGQRYICYFAKESERESLENLGMNYITKYELYSLEL